MKKAHLLLLSLMFTSLLKAQSTTGSTYFFNGNLNENSGGPVLTQTLACNAATGTFGTETITTATGTCGTTPANTFRFNDGGGFQYSNTTNFVRQSYTIHVFFKFNAIGGYSRIIDFSNSTSDNGIYLL
ncbi:MAG: hypothetical protein H0U39_09495 [Segetibacter sp.]|nr:hypothetical protein [Segetibacter sp.]